MGSIIGTRTSAGQGNIGCRKKMESAQYYSYGVKSEKEFFFFDRMEGSTRFAGLVVQFHTNDYVGIKYK